MILVIDASVVVKWFVAESGSDLALEVLAGRALDDAEGVSPESNVLIAPEFVLIEVANVFRRKCAAGEIVEGQAVEALRSLPLLFHRLVPAADIGEAALRIANRLNHPVLDCAYLACAIAADGVLVSADEKFIGKCVRAGHQAQVRGLRTTGA